MKYRLMAEEPGDGGSAGGGDTPPPATPPANTPSASDGGSGDTPPANYFEAMPDDWRNQLAGDNDKHLKMLERVSDMPTFLNNYVSAQDKIRSGQLSSGLPAEPTPEQF